LLGQQARIEMAVARRHLKTGTLVLYDVTSTCLEGRACPLAKFGHDRDRRRAREPGKHFCAWPWQSHRGFRPIHGRENP
jgi:hypothetical protein